MKRPAARLLYYLKLVSPVAVAGAFYWFGYLQGSQSASLQQTPADSGSSPANADAHPAASSDLDLEGKATGIAADDHSPMPAVSLGAEQSEPSVDLIDRLTRSHSPAEALAFIKSDALSDGQKGSALRALVLEWIVSSSALTKKEAARWRRRIGAISGERFGLEVELGLAMSEARLDPSIVQAWLGAYADHPGRSKLFASMLAQQFQNDPLSVLGESSSGTAWEQSLSIFTECPWASSWARCAASPARRSKFAYCARIRRPRNSKRAK